jgi:hypothetical protein
VLHGIPVAAQLNPQAGRRLADERCVRRRRAEFALEEGPTLSTRDNQDREQSG